MRISKLETTTSQLLQHIHNKILDFYKFRWRFFNKNRHLYCQILANQIIPILQNSIYYLYMTAVIGIKIENRMDDSTKLQEILTKYGCNIKTRIGLHDMGEYKCLNYGIILIEVIDRTNEIFDELSKYWNVQIMKF